MKLQVNDIVSLEFLGRLAVARVVEDRGNIGVGGRQLVMIELDYGRFEVPAEELTLVSHPATLPVWSES